MSDRSGRQGAPARAAAEVARASYDRLVAFLAARSRDLATSQDALSEAFREALERWPETGVPDAPEAWLLTVARRRLADAARRDATRDAFAHVLREAYEEAVEVAAASRAFPDVRLKLLFVCAHPAIAVDMHTPLMLQVVLGLDAVRIGNAFLVAPTTMGQRLARAKAKIRDAGISFEVPGPDELAPRLESVLAAVYAAYGTGRDNLGVDDSAASLRDEAVGLARLLAAFLPDESEVNGLLSVLLHCEAREPARRSAGGSFVRLSDQDPRAWEAALLAEADALLDKGSASGPFGRYLFEAAIQSVHGRRALTGSTDWEAIALLYGALVRVAPTVGAAVAHAAAVLEAQGPGAARALLDAFAQSDIASYQPYWAVRAQVLARLHDNEAARAAYDSAIGLSADPAVRAFLQSERAALDP